MTNSLKTQRDIERLRGEIFHMILFSMAWATIGEYALDFKDYAAGVAITLIAVVVLALYSIKLYDREDELLEVAESAEPAVLATSRQMRTDRLYALILIFEGIAVLVSWSILLKIGRDYWVITAFAAIAGLHFFPLAKVISLKSYHALGAWICMLAIIGYWLIVPGKMEVEKVNAFIAYGCAGGALLDGIVIAKRAKGMFPKRRGFPHRT